MNRSESIAKIATALLKAQSTMGNAVKGASNPYFKSKFADLNSIREAVLPAFNAAGITVLQPTVFLDGKAFVETLLLHESGEFLSSYTEIVTAKQNDPQAAGSAISYARRYGLQSFANVGSEDDDGESAMNRGNTPKSWAGKTTLTVDSVAAGPSRDVSLVSGPVSGSPGVGGPATGLAGTVTVEATTTKKPRKTPFNKPGKVEAAPTTTPSNGAADGWN